MGTLNAPREIPYAFRVVEVDGWAWLYDDSERTYICSATPTIYMEPLYSVEDEEDYEYPDGDYFAANVIEAAQSFPVRLDPEYITADVPRKQAWDDAREEAQANCLI